MKYCWKCGAEVKRDDADVCPQCGASLPLGLATFSSDFPSQAPKHPATVKDPKDNPKEHLRLLAKFMTIGVLLFLGLMLLVSLFLLHAPVQSDRSVLYFYPIMAGAGAFFGFVLWWSHEQGPYNPFHD